MIEDKLTYYVPIQRCNPSQFEIHCNHESIKKISFQTDNKNNLSIVFFLNNVFSEDKAKLITREVLERILNYFSIQFNISLGEPVVKNWDLPRIDSEIRRKGLSFSMDAIIVLSEIELNLTENALNIIIEEAEGQKLEKDKLHTGYRFAISQSDPVAKYMSLYSILQKAVSEGVEEKQKEVDDYIKKNVPNVISTPRPGKPRIIETIFTRLRNEVGHKRENALPQNTYKEISLKVEELRNLVRNAIL